jgi:mRNA interferase MazF
MQQRELWMVNLNPTKGSEQAGYRPVLIIGGNLANKYLQTVICLPLTSQIKNYKGNLVLEPNAMNGLKATSEVLTHQIRSIAKERLIEKIGSIDKEQLDTLKESLNDILRY